MTYIDKLGARHKSSKMGVSNLLQLVYDIRYELDTIEHYVEENDVSKIRRSESSLLAVIDELVDAIAEL